MFTFLFDSCAKLSQKWLAPHITVTTADTHCTYLMVLIGKLDTYKTNRKQEERMRQYISMNIKSIFFFYMEEFNDILLLCIFSYQMPSCHTKNYQLLLRNFSYTTFISDVNVSTLSNRKHYFQAELFNCTYKNFLCQSMISQKIYLIFKIYLYLYTYII